MYKLNYKDLDVITTSFNESKIKSNFYLSRRQRPDGKDMEYLTPMSTKRKYDKLLQKKISDDNPYGDPKGFVSVKASEKQLLAFNNSASTPAHYDQLNNLDFPSALRLEKQSGSIIEPTKITGKKMKWTWRNSNSSNLSKHNALKEVPLSVSGQLKNNNEEKISRISNYKQLSSQTILLTVNDIINEGDTRSTID